mgnify:CR=1 FL=1|jgi:hypothetical protein
MDDSPSDVIVDQGWCNFIPFLIFITCLFCRGNWDAITLIMCLSLWMGLVLTYVLGVAQGTETTDAGWRKFIQEKNEEMEKIKNKDV